MPSPTRTPDPAAVPGPQDLTDVAGTPGPQDSADVAGTAGPSALASLGAVPAGAGPRLVAVPSGWPPYDCGAHGAACPAAGVAGDLATAEPGVAGVAGPPPDRSSAPRGAPPPLAAGTALAAPPPPAVPPPGQEQAACAPAVWPGQFAQVIVEILAGSRSSRQIAPWATERVRAQVDGLARRFASDQRPRIRRVVTSRPASAVLEMTVVVGFGPRSRALAMRFEHVPARRPAPGLPGRPARWLCTEMEAG